MNIIKALPVLQFATLLLFASGSALAAGEGRTASAEVIKDADAIVASAPNGEAATTATAQGEPCRFGMCKNPDFAKRKADTVIGLDVLPGLKLRALMGPDAFAPGC